MYTSSIYPSLDTGTIAFSEYYLNSKKNDETESNASGISNNIISYPSLDQINHYYSYKILPIIDNNYFFLSLNKLPFNYRLYLPNGVYLNNASWNFIFDLNLIDDSESENNDFLLETKVVNIKRLSEIHAFLTQLKNKDTEDHEISGMKDLILKIDDLIEKNEYSLIDDFIISFISLDFSFQFHISLLISTLQMKEHLKDRNKLIENTMLIGRKVLSPEELTLTLQGLI